MLPTEGGHYELLAQIARGGMGTVFLARLRRSEGFSRLVAVKCMHREYVSDPEFTAMFLDEAGLAARLHHPNIVSTLDVVSDGRQLLMVMEYIDGVATGELLTAMATKGETIPVAIACAFVHDLLLGLHAAHEATDETGASLGVVHRDVSPQNLIVGFDGLARVLDFGVAKARCHRHQTAPNELKGKIRYMAPEQIRCEGVDRRTDVYAAGVVLWELLCARPLFTGPPELIAAKVCAGVVPPPSTRADDISPELDAIVLRAVSSDANARYATALEMAQAIAEAIALPHRTAVAEWIAERASPRPIPSAPLVDDSSAIVAALDEAESTRVHVEVTPPRRRRRLAWGAAAAAALGATLFAASLAKSAVFTHRDVPIHSSIAPVAIAPAAPEIAIEPAPAATPSPTPTPPPVTKSAARLRRAPEPKREPACALPYTLDAHGKRHFKIECL
jgi:serine/threonine-protein kinase